LKENLDTHFNTSSKIGGEAIIIWYNSAASYGPSIIIPGAKLKRVVIAYAVIGPGSAVYKSIILNKGSVGTYSA
jgi:hypothetical protein